MHRMPIAVAAAGLLVSLATPVAAETPAPPDAAEPPRTATAHDTSADKLPPRRHYDDYVAMGDSFTAGPLIHPIRLDRPLGCVVSARNYPARLAAYFDVDTYRDVSCSGARSKHLWHPQQTFLGTNPPQLRALSPDTDLVTLGMGGNDFGLVGSLVSACAEVREKNPDGAPCRKKFTENGVDTKLRDARRIRGHIAKSLRKIHRRAPYAEVVVIGYLRTLPPVGTCEEVPFAAGDYRWGDRVQRRLNSSLRQAARRNDATYVNMYPASTGHDACGDGIAWINGSTTKLLRAAAFHPFAKGMKGIARETYRQLTGYPAPRVAPFETGAPTLRGAQARRLAHLLSPDA